MAPEALRDDAVSEGRDTYALGVVLYQLLTGRLPFEAETFEGLVYRILNDNARPPSVHAQTLPAALDRLVLRVLEKNPKLRLTIERLITELAALQTSGVLETGRRRARTGFGARVDRSLGRIVRQLTTMAPSQTRKLVMMASVSVVSIGVLGWLVTRALPQGPVKPKVASLAIIPLFNESRESGFEYIGHGLAEHLAGRLGGLEGLLVQPYRRWIFGDATELCGQLKVEGVLEGAFSVIGGAVEARVDLVTADGEREVVANTKSQGYKQAAEDLASAVAKSLKSRLTAAEVAHVAVPAAGSNEAFDALSTAVDAQQRGDRDEALRWYERAVSLDPGLAKAYVGMGAIHYDRYYRGTGPAQNLDLATSYFQQALALEPNNSGALQGMILVHFERGERDSGLALAARAAGSGVSAIDALMVPAVGYLLNPMAELSIPPLQKLIELDPRNLEAYWWLAIARVWANQLDEAVSAGTEFFSRFDEDPEIHAWVAIAHWKLRNDSLAAHHFQRAFELFGTDGPLLESVCAGDFYTEIGNPAKARETWLAALRVAERRRALAPDNWRTLDLLCTLHLRLKNRDAFAREVENLKSRLVGRPMPTLDAMWISGSLTEPELRDGTIRFLREHVGRKHPIWMMLDMPWQGPSAPIREGPELMGIYAAARAYDDSLRRRFGLPVRPGLGDGL
jgi:tetratricopeptide (TPR) repeat protein